MPGSREQSTVPNAAPAARRGAGDAAGGDASTTDRRPALANWRVVTDEGDGIEAVSTPFASQHAAVGFARDLLAAGLRVLRITGPQGPVPAEAVATLCAAPVRLGPTVAEP